MVTRLKYSLGALALLVLFMGCDPRTPKPPEKVVINYKLTLTANPQVIYADHGKTTSRVTAVLTQEDGTPVQGAIIKFSALQGAIASNIATSNAGVAVATFYDQGEPGDSVLIVARYTDDQDNTVRDSVYITVLPLEALVSNFFASTRPVDGQVQIIKLDSSYAVDIIAHVRDSAGVAVRNVAVQYQVLEGANIGYLSAAMDSTDGTGTSTVIFYSNPSDTGNVTVEAYVETGALQALMRQFPGVYDFGSLLKTANPQSHAFSDTVYFRFNPPPIWTLRVFTPRDTVFADTGAAMTQVYALLTDENNEPVASEQVQFSTTVGTIESNKTTNTAGVAQTVLSGLGAEVTHDTLAQITARVTHPFYGNLVSSHSVLVEFNPPPTWNLRLFSTETTIYADNGITVANIYALLTNEHNEPVDSQMVQFSTTVGSIESGKFTNSAGIAQTVLSDLGSEITQDTVARVTARVSHPLYGQVTAQTTVQILAENPSAGDRFPQIIDVVADRTVLPPPENPEITSASIVATVTDSSGFPVNTGTLVQFFTNMGFVTPFDVTDENGQARATFSMGDSSGIARIYARAGNVRDSVLIEIRPSVPAYINILPANPNHIVVAGGWGVQSTTIEAEVRDARGELVDMPYLVRFELGPVHVPAGANLNGEGTVSYDTTNHGIAAVTLNSGTEAGNVRVVASVTVDDSTELTAVAIPVTIEAGPPAYIYPDADQNSISPIGGGIYQMELGARVWDQFTNPVEDSTQVYWFLIPDSIGHVVGSSFTGNMNLGGDHFPGIAWTRIYWNSDNVFDRVQVVARVHGANDSLIENYVNAVEDSTVLLPFYPGTLTVFPDHTYHDFQPADNPTPDSVILTAILVDYYGNAIKNGRILFFAEGVSQWQEYSPDYPMLNGMPIVRTDNSGIAYIIAVFEGNICVPIFDANNNVTGYTPFTSYVWGRLLDPQQVSSDQVAIQFVRTIQGQ